MRHRRIRLLPLACTMCLVFAGPSHSGTGHGFSELVLLSAFATMPLAPPCVSNDDCDNGLFCDGQEVCDPDDPQADADGCAPGSDPCAAPTDKCSEATGCVECLTNEQCNDNDPCTAGPGGVIDECIAGECENLCNVQGCEQAQTLVIPDGCYGPGDVVCVALNLTSGSNAIVGGQFFLDYDPAQLLFLSADPGDGSGCNPGNDFCLELFEVVPGDGNLTYLVGIFPGEPGNSGPATMATFCFEILGDPDSTCAGTEFGGPTVNVTFDDSGPFQNQLTVAGGGPVLFPVGVCSDLAFEVTDTEVSDTMICPNSGGFNADAGTSTQNVSWPEVQASSNCETLVVECSGDNAAVVSTSGGSFNAGLTNVTCTATAECGQVGECSFQVTINNQNTVQVNVEECNIDGAGPFVNAIRGMTFSLTSEAGACEATELSCQDVTLVDSFGFVEFDVSAASYDCARARDDLHTLGSTVTPGIVDLALAEGALTATLSAYTLDFTAGNCLLLGNLNGDDRTDILDFGVFQPLDGGTGDSPCVTAAPHTDLNGDGALGAIDLTIIQKNLLNLESLSCCGIPGADRFVAITTGAEWVVINGRRFFVKIPIDEFARYDVSPGADIDGDGDVDVDDIEALLGQLSDQARTHFRLDR